MAELMALMGTTAAGSAAAAAPAAAGAGAASGMLGPATFGTAEGMLAAGAPTTMDLLGGSAFGTANAGLLGAGMKGLDLAGSGMGGGTASLFGDPNGLDFLKWSNATDQSLPIKTAQDALKMMQNDGPKAQPMGSRPPGYSPTDPLEVQFARIMGWLKDNGGRA